MAAKCDSKAPTIEAVIHLTNPDSDDRVAVRCSCRMLCVGSDANLAWAAYRIHLGEEV